jgi:hypothetical protein
MLGVFEKHQRNGSFFFPQAIANNQPAGTQNMLQWVEEANAAAPAVTVVVVVVKKNAKKYSASVPP